MLSHLELDPATAWLHEPSVNWSDDLGQLPPIGAPTKRGDSVFGSSTDGLLEKLNDDKLARDVEDLSAIFEELDGGVVDFPLPCDEEEVATGAEVTGDWIGDLEKDVVNVDELSSMFDALVEEQAATLNSTGSDVDTVETSDEEDESMYESDGDDCEDVDEDDCCSVTSATPSIVYAPPTWASMAPLDPRSVIRAPIFKNLDARIPRVEIPRIDLGLGVPGFTLKPANAVQGLRSESCVSPKKSTCSKDEQYHHDPESCWICKSDKSPYKKYALHRYLEKRHRRNWKRGPRYSGRSHVATNRVREGGRFVTTAYWV